MDVKEALNIVREFQVANYPQCVDAGIALADYLEGVIVGVKAPEEIQNKFESWTQLQRAGKVFDAKAEEIKRERKFWEAIAVLAEKAIGMMIAANTK